MKVTIEDREFSLLHRLQDRLDRVAMLQCAVHGAGVAEMAIHARENGWFDVLWTTCCDDLRRQAAAIVKDRC